MEIETSKDVREDGCEDEDENEVLSNGGFFILFFDVVEELSFKMLSTANALPVSFLSYYTGLWTKQYKQNIP